MNSDELINLGNEYRSIDNYEKALECYASVFVKDRNNAAAWSNYGNVLREMGEPNKAIPFLQHATEIEPNFVTAQFNLSIAQLLKGDYQNGFKQYEWRWQFEHLAGTKPQIDKPEWQGQDLKGKTILVISEQGFGDVIQFSRFIVPLVQLGAQIILLTMPGLVPLFQPSSIIKLCTSGEGIGNFDYWCPIMSLPYHLQLSKTDIKHELCYILAQDENIAEWAKKLGTKEKIRIGVCWSGRKDNWVNRYKSFPLEKLVNLANQYTEYEWINLQVECTDIEQKIIEESNIKVFPNSIQHWGNTAGMVHHLDLIISADTSIAHLASAMGKPTWIPLTKFAVDWRWGVESDNTVWYPSAKLFRQPNFGDWDSVFDKIEKFLPLFKI